MQKEETAPGNLSFAPAHAQLTIFREKIRRPNSARQPVKSAARVHREATEPDDGTSGREGTPIRRAEKKQRRQATRKKEEKEKENDIEQKEKERKRGKVREVH